MYLSLTQEKKARGFIVLYAALVGGLVLTIGLIVFNISLRELILSSQARESHSAFVAADAGLECALFWDMKHPGYSQSIFGGSPSGTAINKGLMGYWKLNDGRGSSDAVDSSGLDNDGFLVNMEANADWVTGVVGDALTFDGLDEYLDLTNAVSSINPSEGAFSFWVYISSSQLYSGTNADILDFGSDSDNYLFFSKNASNVFVWRYRSGGAHSQVRIINSTQVAAFADTWKHVVLMWDDNGGGDDDMWIYVDGELKASGSRDVADISPLAITKGLLAGSWHGVNPNRFFQGEIDEVRIYDRVLTEGEIDSLALRSGAFVNPVAPETGTGADLNCVGENITYSSSGWDPDSGWEQDLNIDVAATTTFDLLFSDDSCATVTAAKVGGRGVIESRGYNTCDIDNPRRVERALRVIY